jgi:hypothetical protein
MNAGRASYLLSNIPTAVTKPDLFSQSHSSNNSLPAHGAMSTPSSIHFAMEIKQQDYQDGKAILKEEHLNRKRS